MSPQMRREYPNADDVNVIAIDSIYTPIRNVKYAVENFRVEQKTDYEKLVLEISHRWFYSSEGSVEGSSEDSDSSFHVVLR